MMLCSHCCEGKETAVKKPRVDTTARWDSMQVVAIPLCLLEPSADFFVTDLPFSYRKSRGAQAGLHLPSTHMTGVWHHAQPSTICTRLSINYTADF